MWLVWLGLGLLAFKLSGIGPSDGLPWLMVVAPFLAALVWFEVLEPLLGFDRAREAHDEIERVKRERVERAWRRTRRRD